MTLSGCKLQAGRQKCQFSRKLAGDQKIFVFSSVRLVLTLMLTHCSKYFYRICSPCYHLLNYKKRISVSRLRHPRFKTRTYFFNFFSTAIVSNRSIHNSINNKFTLILDHIAIFTKLYQLKNIKK